MHDQVIDAAGTSCPACEPADPLLRVPLPSVADLGTVAEARAAIDGLDAALAVLLERRAEVAALVQRLKPVGGFAGRNPDRERAIVDAMAERAPSLGRDRLARIMNAVIEAGLDAAER
ncbi:chorismate mutase [Actinomadura sp. LD22]|uniref:Chorismate mutase n=1 Tax=Actinomadura physcomitrii TaxID=2650748 RepID=A0A6I4MHE9_9ACTN|nr:chorismate mutase [Actinomadura physcomitrii]MWA04320.1 chorismate mutase [Actinomadura physcomitrii]